MADEQAEPKPLEAEGNPASQPKETPAPVPAAGGDGGAGEDDAVDLEQNQEPKFEEGPPEVKERPIEQVRAQVARTLVAILAVVIFFSFLTLWMVSPPPGLADLEKILTIIFGPLIALVSGAVGYYFGGKSGGDG
jgi:hypothetical protein